MDTNQPPGPAPEEISTPQAMAALRNSLKNNLDYAWTWHCNLACAMQDEGVDHDVANKAAARFMQVLAGVDTSKYVQGKVTQQGAQVPQGADAESRAMFVARLENMQENGDHWLTVASVLALLNDCDYLASRSSSPQAPAQPDRHRHASEPYSRGRRKPLCEGGTVWFRGECGECDLAAVNIFTTPARPAPQAKPSKSEDKGR